MSRARGEIFTTCKTYTMNPDLTIRALMQIDRLQPKFAAYTGATVQGSIPLAGDTVLIGELAPGNEVFRLVDKALKGHVTNCGTRVRLFHSALTDQFRGQRSTRCHFERTGPVHESTP